MGAPKAQIPQRIHWDFGDGGTNITVDFVGDEETTDLSDISGPTLRTLMKTLNMRQERDWNTFQRHLEIRFHLDRINAIGGAITFDIPERHDIEDHDEPDHDDRHGDGDGDGDGEGEGEGEGPSEKPPINVNDQPQEGDGDGDGGNQPPDIQFMVQVNNMPTWCTVSEAAELLGVGAGGGGAGDPGNGPTPEWTPPEGGLPDPKPEGKAPEPDHDERSTHEKMADALAALATGQHVLLWGEAGSGKSTAATEYARLMGINFHQISGNPHLMESRLIGHHGVGGWIDGPAAKAVRLDELLLFDEADNTSPSIGATLNMLMANGTIAADETLVAGDRFRVVMTANTNGNGATSEFVGRFQMDHALKDRVYSIHWQTDYAFERYLVRHTFGLDRKVADEWLAICHLIRRNVEEFALKTGVTMRTVLSGAKALAMMSTDAYRESGFKTLSYHDLITGRVLAKVPQDQAAKMVQGISF
jgi:energy-coupling factor transporter ATP-binding protein EcfA2